MKVATIQIEQFLDGCGYNGVNVVADVDAIFNPADPSVGYKGEWQVVGWFIKSVEIFDIDGEVCSKEMGEFRDNIESQFYQWTKNHEDSIHERFAEQAKCD